MMLYIHQLHGDVHAYLYCTCGSKQSAGNEGNDVHHRYGYLLSATFITLLVKW